MGTHVTFLARKVVARVIGLAASTWLFSWNASDAREIACPCYKQEAVRVWW